VVFSPARQTPPLTPDFKAGIDKYLPAFELAWSVANGEDFKFDPWQRELLRRVTELLPSGELRFRSVLISCPRQSGKTEILTAIGLFALMRKPKQANIGIASQADQARILYNRLQGIIFSNPTLSNMMRKNTETRGIKTTSETTYDIRAGRAETLQGIPISIGIVDEVHLVDEDAYSALVAGQGARKDSCIYGITTAGNEDSKLLARLYASADKAIAGELPRFGAWIWEASEAYVPKGDDELMALLTQANPSIQDGRKDVADVLYECRSSIPEDDIVRYYLNRFIKSSTNTFIPFAMWQKNERGIDEKLPDGQVVFGIDRTPDWEHATVAAAVLVDGIIHTEIVASIVKPTLEKMVNIANQLHKHSPRAIMMDGLYLRDLHNELELRGLNSKLVAKSDVIRASSTFYSRLASETLKHAPDPLLSVQIPRTVKKAVADGFMISRIDSSVEIDSVMATVIACHGAETLKAVATRSIMI
jgi:phage terminase large subunit-like protein